MSEVIESPTTDQIEEIGEEYVVLFRVREHCPFCSTPISGGGEVHQAVARESIYIPENKAHTCMGGKQIIQLIEKGGIARLSSLRKS